MSSSTQPANDTARLFTAVWPDAEVRAAILAHRAAWKFPPDARLTIPERLHLTLNFLGEVPRSLLPQIISKLRQSFEPFTLYLTDAALWHQGIAVLEPSHVPDELLQLQTHLRKNIEQLGIPLEKRVFRPHVTLARQALQARPPLARPSIEWQVQSYALMESPRNDNKAYLPLQTYP